MSNAAAGRSTIVALVLPKLKMRGTSTWVITTSKIPQLAFILSTHMEDWGAVLTQAKTITNYYPSRPLIASPAETARLANQNSLGKYTWRHVPFWGAFVDLSCFWAQSRWDTSNLKPAVSTRSLSRFLAVFAWRSEPSLNMDWVEGLDDNIQSMGAQYVLNDFFRFFSMLGLILCCRILGYYHHCTSMEKEHVKVVVLFEYCHY